MVRVFTWAMIAALVVVIIDTGKAASVDHAMKMAAVAGLAGIIGFLIAVERVK